jgi:flagellar basal-body rod modification protein FlgD
MIDTNMAVAAPTTPLRDLGLRESYADPNANDLDKDAFLQLLVAQLRYQDPLNPSDPAEFMATTAQFTVVEKLDELTQQGANTAIISGLSMASSLVGRTVTYVGNDDAIATGVVSSAQVNGGEVRLVTDSGVVDLSTVIGIGETNSPDSTQRSPAAGDNTAAAPTTSGDSTAPNEATPPSDAVLPNEAAPPGAEAPADEAPPPDVAAPLEAPPSTAATPAPPISTSSVSPTPASPTPASPTSPEPPLLADLATDTNEPKEPTS